jgi:hypothetical protein
VNGHRRARSRREPLLEALRVHAEGIRLDVREDRARAQPDDGARGGEEGEGGYHDLVAGTHPDRVQSQDEGVGTARAADRTARAGQPGDLALELADLRAEHEVLALDDRGKRSLEVVPVTPELLDQVEQRHGSIAHARVSCPGRASECSTRPTRPPCYSPLSSGGPSVDTDPPRRRPGERLLVAYFLAAGLFLLLVPWTRTWNAHPLLLDHPDLRDLVTSPFLRGAVSGLGALMLLVGLHDIGRPPDGGETLPPDAEGER